MTGKGGKKDVLKQWMEEKGLKSTSQRDDIADTFFRTNTHLSLDELLQKVRKRSPRIGYATVYRTMKLLTESGLAVERHFGDRQTRYEPVPDKGHHDHLICTSCGTIIEFENEKIERLQREVASDNNFIVTSHKLELYGLCSKCHSEKKEK